VRRLPLSKVGENLTSQDKAVQEVADKRQGQQRPFGEVAKQVVTAKEIQTEQSIGSQLNWQRQG